MKKIFEKIISSFFLLVILSSNSWSEIIFKEVTVSGIGQSYEEALNNAFAEAISLVNGKNVQTKTIIQVMSGGSVPEEVAEDKEKIREHQILVDSQSENCYLLQIFSKNLFGPIFIEMIQRVDDGGFGEGNFQALFESIERDQERRGVL